MNTNCDAQRTNARKRFHAYPLDGAMLYFHPETGTHVRVQSGATRTLVRQAPRVVMFGITNVCNLHCDFCSRDAERKSAWTLDSAATVLEGLARAGTLEVAFGGGEPFSFRSFEALLLRLHATTPLALNVTTNGTLLREDQLVRLRGVLGQVRLSIYDDQPWRVAARTLQRAGTTWGANVLVDDATLPRLTGLLLELEELGARDVSLLAYVGADSRRHLTPAGETRLAAIVRGSTIACRVSVCFGDRLALPRLFDGADDAGDCGAGVDFVTIAPDKRVQSCSFHEASFPIESAADVLAIWRTQRDALGAASPRRGCARSERATASSQPDGIRVWQGFSGNNSGECVLVAKFDRAEDAESVLAELVPGYTPGEKYGDAWNDLFNAKKGTGDYEFAPDEIITLGRTLVARTDSAPEDDFPALRAFAWKRGGEVLAGGVHVHEETTALFAMRASDAREREALFARAREQGAVAATYGDFVIAALSNAERPQEAPLAWMREKVLAVASSNAVGMELYCDRIDESSLAKAMQKVGALTTAHPRLAVRFWAQTENESIDHAARFATSIDGAATHVRQLVLVDRLVRKKRVAVRAYGEGGTVTSLDGDPVLVNATFWRQSPPRTKGAKAQEPAAIDPAALRDDLQARLRRALGATEVAIDDCESGGWGGRVSVRVRTSAPAETMTSLDAHAREEGLSLWLGIEDVEPLTRAIQRVIGDVVAIEKDRRTR